MLTVIVPSDEAELTIQAQVMQTTGKSREFDLPIVEVGKLFEYDFTVKFAPNNYTTITRKKTVQFKGASRQRSISRSKTPPIKR